MKRWSLPFLLVLASCAGSASAATTVENYFRALVEKDATKAVTLSCAAWETGALTDVDTFSMYPATLEDIACRNASPDGQYQLVECTGKAVLDYNGEKQEIDLSARAYKVLQEGGEWRMCGYQ